MLDVLVSILAFVFTLGILIAVHEFGHYWVARKSGVKVLRFSIGFGRPIWTRKHGTDQTEYVLAAIPFGGYVKMLDEREGEVAESEVHRAFNRQPLYKRFAIVAAGPGFNFVFAIAAYWLLFISGIPGLAPVVGAVTPDSTVAVAGLRAGDRITAVDDELTPTWSVARMALLTRTLKSHDQITLSVKGADGGERQLKLDFVADIKAVEKSDVLTLLGITPWQPAIDAVIGRLEKGAPAAVAGFQVNDRIVAVDGMAVNDWYDWVDYIRSHGGVQMVVQIDRAGKPMELSLQPELVGHGEKAYGRIGAAAKDVGEIPADMQSVQRYGIFAAVKAGMIKTWDMSCLTLHMMGQIVMGKASLDNLSGPITIAQYAGQSASIGWLQFLSFLAIVSISLGVLNLLPVPVLDGGHLLFYIVEFFKGSPLSEQVQIAGQKVGLVLLLMLMVVAFYNDLVRLFG